MITYQMTTDCLASRHNLLIDVDGKTRICCNNHEPLDSDPEDIGSALVGALATEIRSHLDTGLRHPSCHRCWAEEDKVGHSYRRDYNDLYGHYHGRDPRLHTLHMQSENTCNLTCVYCGPAYSSKWAQLIDVRESRRGLTRISDQTIAGLEMITFAGGEPALIKTNIDILNRLFDLNPRCQIIVNTNLTCYGNDFFRMCQRFPNLKLLISFEATGERYEYIRHLAKWSEFSQNFARACDEIPAIDASMIFFPLSAGTLESTLDWTMRYLGPESISLNTYQGDDILWNMINAKILDRMRDRLLKYAEQTDLPLKDQLIMHCQTMQSTNLNTYIPRLDKFDSFYNIDHRKVFTELYE